EGTALRRNRSHLKPRCFDIPIINKNFTFRTTTPSQSEIYNRHLAGPAHPPKVKYSSENDLSGPAHPPKVKYSQSVPKITLKRVSDTAYDSYISETLVPLRSAIRPQKMTRFESDPVTSVRHIPARPAATRMTNSQPSQRTFDAVRPGLLIPISMSQPDKGTALEDLEESEAGEASDTLKAHSPPQQPCVQIQAQESDIDPVTSIAHCRTSTPSQSEIFSNSSNNNDNTQNISQNISQLFRTSTPSQSEIYSDDVPSDSTSMTGTETDIREEMYTPSQSDIEPSGQSDHEHASSDQSSFRTSTSSQSEVYRRNINNNRKFSSFRTCTPSQVKYQQNTMPAVKRV
ncbi:MAG: hypothetical protein MJE68_19670, partial [Proteobacteria bacterium]|nr:hypothetical protein [Pseudomonadota bacterium]